MEIYIIETFRMLKQIYTINGILIGYPWALSYYHWATDQM